MRSIPPSFGRPFCELHGTLLLILFPKHSGMVVPVHAGCSLSYLVRVLDPKEGEEVTLGTSGLHQRNLGVACDLGQLSHFSQNLFPCL